MSEQEHSAQEQPAEADRRRFLASVSQVAMGVGLVSSYGTLAYMAGRFLYPAEPTPTAWVFVAETARIPQEGVLKFTTPAGQTVTIRRVAENGDAADFLAMSSTCPHLGCQVHWEPHNNRFFCPCHNGVFDPSGIAIEGPPAEARQSLPLYPLRVENGLLFIEVPAKILT
ncbi:MAG: ubiquinol-cytochrome c reductase iron-sulfur subunit [Gemmatales bacterium]|nr:ubiquinol-cytochrome c reductase iron-sulfur subunit [Gemmatales bacterium]MDW8386023.1 ubiquinol-cytochrome c reductase iron-sulfur subunit [Gemmatales bacterium]